MLKANVGLSRKVTRDYQSSGYTINIEGEITAPPDHPDAIKQQVHRLFLLAEEALAREIDRDQGEDAIGRRDEQPSRPSNSYRNEREPAQEQGNGYSRPRSNGQEEPATNKQVQYMLSLAKRQGLSKAQLEERIEDLLGSRLTIYQLTKKEAGRVIDTLNQDAPSNGRR